MEFWQAFLPRATPRAAWRDSFEAPLPDGSALALPLRDLGETAVAGFVANQATFALVVAMAQGERWAAGWPGDIPLRAVFATPVFSRGAGGWVPVPGSAPHDRCPLMPKGIAA